MGGTLYCMVKTTVYLDEADAAALRRLAVATGRSQAALIREAIADKTRAAAPRRLSFIGVGRGSGEPIGRYADEIVRAELGRSAR
ncbi:MAG: ribbon-helix-helix protein, CopG family [Solirubrobacteraceae bacterium]